MTLLLKSNKNYVNRADKYNGDWTWRPFEGQFGFKDGGQFNLSFQSNLEFTVEKS